MKVNQLAEALNVSSDTVRYYTRIKFLKPEVDSSNGYKVYNLKDENRLRFILSARQLGFSVKDIKSILTESDKGQAPCAKVRVLMESRMSEVELKFQEMVKLRERMLSAIETWRGIPDGEPTGEMICHLIEGFSYKQ